MFLGLYSFLFLVTCLHAQGICPASESEYDADVLILGAGMSGISAAKTLYENGVKNFMILEARDRIGGRMRSEEFGGIRVELGSYWVYGIHLTEDPPERLSGNNDMQQLVERLGVIGVIADVNKSAVHDGSGLMACSVTDPVVDRFVHVIENTMNYSTTLRKRKGLPDQSVKEGLRENNWSATTPLEKLIEWDYNFVYHQDTRFTSLYKTVPFKWFDFGEDYFMITDQRGSEYILHCLGEDFGLKPNDPRLKLNTRVFHVHNGNSCVCVDTVSGWRRKTYCAKYALVTFSVGVLQSPGTVQFFPALPKEKRDLFNFFTPMAQMVRIFLQFNYSFWEDDATFIKRVDTVLGNYAVFQPFDYHGYNITTPDNPSNVIVWSLTDKIADKVSSQPDWVTKNEVMELLREMYPNSYIPEPKDFLVTNWKNDPLYYGSTVTTPVGTTDEMYEVLSAPVGQLYFSGDGMHKHYSGFLHGAYYSGIETGQIIAKRICK